jgi:Lrp/AsnC family leucine-responsive transcriptional regulator
VPSFGYVVGMDAVDGEIIGHLRENGRISFSELGRLVGLSTNAAAARVRKLERAEVILGYRAVIAGDVPEARSSGLEAFIDVRLRPDGDSDAFLALAEALPPVRDAVHVTGPYDYLLHVVVSDTGQLDALLRRLNEVGAAQTQTRLALRVPRQESLIRPASPGTGR